MRVVIVDDEYYGHENLKRKLDDFVGNEIVGVFESGESFLQVAKKINPDVVFLDIEMPEMNGFDVLERLQEMNLSPSIIFVTGSREYAAQAFEINAFDYIVKPVTSERLSKALSRIMISGINKNIFGDDYNNPGHQNVQNDTYHTSYSENTNINSISNINQTFDISSNNWSSNNFFGKTNVNSGAEVSLFNNSKYLTICCFGSFSIKSGKQELNTGWRTKKSEELLAYLICAKGAFVTKEKVAEELWPERDRDKSIASFHVAFHYVKQLEKLMGITFPIESKRSTMRIMMDQINLDIQVFDDLIALANNKQANEVNQIEWLEKAADLYRGGLLEDRYYSWSTSMAQQYEMKYEEILNRLIDYYEDRNSSKKLTFYRACFARLTGIAIG